MFDPLPASIDALNQSKLVAAVIENRLLKAPPEQKRYFPSVFSEQPFYMTYTTPEYFIAAFLNRGDESKLEEHNQVFDRPFPFLIAETPEMAVWIWLQGGAKNAYFRGVVVNGMPSFRLDRDTTLILVDHIQDLSPRAVYVVKLAYIMTFGEEVLPENAHEYLEDMIAYSIRQWRTRNDRQTSS